MRPVFVLLCLVVLTTAQRNWYPQPQLEGSQSWWNSAYGQPGGSNQQQNQPQLPAAYPPHRASAFSPQQHSAYSPQKPSAYSPQQSSAFLPQQPSAFPPHSQAAYSPQQHSALLPRSPAAFLPQQPSAFLPQPSAAYARQPAATFLPQPPAVYLPQTTVQLPSVQPSAIASTPTPWVGSPSHPSVQPRPPSFRPQSTNSAQPSLQPTCKSDPREQTLCRLHLGEFEEIANRAMRDAVFFLRRSNASCTDCEQLCAQYQTFDSPWVCRAMTYDRHWKICDLFAVTHLVDKYDLVCVDGKDYFRVLTPGRVAAERTTPGQITTTTPAPNSATDGVVSATTISAITVVTDRVTDSGPTTPSAPQTPAPDSGTPAPAGPPNSCTDSNLLPIYSIFSNYEFIKPQTSPVLVPIANTDVACRDACTKSINIAPRVCKVYTFVKGVCNLSEKVDKFEIKDHKSKIQKVQNSDSVIGLQTCIERNIYVKLGDATFDVLPQKVLAGYVKEATTAQNLTDCQLQCLKKATFACKSGVYYPNDPTMNCLLNEKTREDFPTGFGTEIGGFVMAYFDYNDTMGVDFITNDHAPDREAQRWTEWMDCATSLTGYTTRYLRCATGRDIRKCPKQSRRCGVTRNAARVDTIKFGPCLAIKDHTGTKRCPHGTRRLSDGSSEYCQSPIDCPKHTGFA